MISPAQLRRFAWVGFTVAVASTPIIGLAGVAAALPLAAVASRGALDLTRASGPGQPHGIAVRSAL